MFSVIIPLYNKESTILRAVNSVLNQTFQYFEIIIIDDGSTDNSLSTAQQINDNRLTIVSQPNAGVSAARNKGISLAKYEYISFLDADDEWLPEYLKTISFLIKKYTAAGVFATSYKIIYKDKTESYPVINGLHDCFQHGILSEYFTIAAKSSPPLWSSVITVRKTNIDEIGGFPIDVTSGEDLLTWARLFSITNIAYCLKHEALFHQDSSDPLVLKARVPQKNDKVGNGLILLLNNQKDTSGLRRYISLWFRMRANCYLRNNYRLKAFNESLKALYYNPILYKNLIYLFLCIMPAKIWNKVLGK